MQEQRQRRHVRERRIEEEKAASRKPPQEHQLAQRPDGSIDLSATSPPPPPPPVSHDHAVHGTRQQDADRTQAREDWGGEFHQLREQVAGLLALLREREGAVRDREGGGLRDAAGGAWLQRDIRPGDDAPTTAGGRAMGTESMSSPQARAALDEAGPEEVAGEHSKGKCNSLSELQSQVGVGSILPSGQEPVGMHCRAIVLMDGACVQTHASLMLTRCMIQVDALAKRQAETEKTVASLQQAKNQLESEVCTSSSARLATVYSRMLAHKRARTSMNSVHGAVHRCASCGRRRTTTQRPRCAIGGPSRGRVRNMRLSLKLFSQRLPFSRPQPKTK